LMAWPNRGGGSWSGCVFTAPQVGGGTQNHHALSIHVMMVGGLAQQGRRQLVRLRVQGATGGCRMLAE
jgi:hypothetical protein